MVKYSCFYCYCSHQMKNLMILQAVVHGWAVLSITTSLMMKQVIKYIFKMNVSECLYICLWHQNFSLKIFKFPSYIDQVNINLQKLEINLGTAYLMHITSIFNYIHVNHRWSNMWKPRPTIGFFPVILEDDYTCLFDMDRLILYKNYNNPTEFFRPATRSFLVSLQKS